MITNHGIDVAPGARLARDSGWEAEEETLLDRFNRHFACATADTPNLLMEALQTRYQVYCVENGFEDPRAHADGLETDDYDTHSEHSVLIHRGGAGTIGTVRLILPEGGTRLSPAAQFILECQGSTLPFPPVTTAEVSRFSIRKYQPRSSTDQRQAFLRRATNEEAVSAFTGPMMSLGLIQGAVRMSILHNITHWCAIIEPKFLRMLAAMGIRFTPVGPLVEHHGRRQPCHLHIESMLNRVKMERPSFWDVITDGGTLSMRHMPEVRRRTP